MKKSSFFSVVLCFCIPAAMMQGCAKTLPNIQPETTTGHAGSSSLKLEMRMLNEAYKNLIECIILKMPEGIEDPFLEVKKARISTEEALKNRDIYLPRDSGNIEQFKEMRNNFYKRVDLLIEASKKKDREALRRVIGRELSEIVIDDGTGQRDIQALRDLTPQLLNDCIMCHDRFRS